MAEREGFVTPDLLQSTVFKTVAIDHSAISPGAKVVYLGKLSIDSEKNIVNIPISVVNSLLIDVL